MHCDICIELLFVCEKYLQPDSCHFPSLAKQARLYQGNELSDFCRGCIAADQQTPIFSINRPSLDSRSQAARNQRFNRLEALVGFADQLRQPCQ